MNTDDLRRHLENWAATLEEEDRELLQARLRGLASVFPFNEYEYIIAFLLDRGILSFADYEPLRSDYVAANRYLDLYGLAPRVFGQVWAEKHLRDLDSRFQKPDRRLDPEYAGQYDVWLEGMRVEAKASRAVDSNRRATLASKALSHDSGRPFWMNFQQLKLDVCDAFVFIGVWVDTIVYWVLSSEEVRASRFLSHQHRGGIEYQIGIRETNLGEFDVYRVAPEALVDAVLGKRR